MYDTGTEYSGTVRNMCDEELCAVGGVCMVVYK